MTSYVAIRPVVVVARSTGGTSTIGYGDPVPADATSAAITHLLALSYIAEGGSVPHESSRVVPVPASGDAGKVVTVNEGEDGYELDTPSGGGDSLPIADPTGVTTGTADNDIKGSGTISWVQFPEDTVVAAWGLEGDAFPRVVLGVDPTNNGVIFLGDGTEQPSSVIYLNGNRITVSGAFAADSILVGDIAAVGAAGFHGVTPPAQSANGSTAEDAIACLIAHGLMAAT